MKQKINKLLSLIFLGIIIIISGCKDDPIVIDSTIPSQVSNVQFTPVNVGGFFIYKVPADEDFLYVKAEYTLDTGDKVFRVASVFSDSLTIDGLGSVKPYEVKLISVDRYGNKSEPVIQTITPLISNPEKVLTTVAIYTAFSGVDVVWENKVKGQLRLYVVFNNNGKEVTRVSSSNAIKGAMTISGLPSTPIEFKVYIKDDYQNKTIEKSMGVFTPYEDFKLDKTLWTFLRDTLLPRDTMYEIAYNPKKGRIDTAVKTAKFGNYPGSAGLRWNSLDAGFDGNIIKFWDDIIDVPGGHLFNYFNTSTTQNPPFSYYIDLGKTCMLTRVTLWPRNDGNIGFPYGNDDVETFEIWGSTDKLYWTKIKRNTNTKPGNPVDATAKALDGYEFTLYDTVPKYSIPVHYIEFRGIKVWSGNEGSMSEMTLFGKYADK